MSDLYNNFENKFITLPSLNIADLPQTWEFNGNEFVVKQEFHITLLNIDYIVEIIGSKNVENLKPEIADEFYKFVSKQPLTQYTLLNELRLVSVAEDNKTIVVMAKLEGIDKFFDNLSEKYGVALPVQPAHITLYTLPTDMFGIPINSYEELEKISEPIDIPELQELL